MAETDVAPSCNHMQRRCTCQCCRLPLPSICSCLSHHAIFVSEQSNLPCILWHSWILLLCPSHSAVLEKKIIQNLFKKLWQVLEWYDTHSGALFQDFRTHFERNEWQRMMPHVWHLTIVNSNFRIPIATQQVGGHSRFEQSQPRAGDRAKNIKYSLAGNRA